MTKTLQELQQSLENQVLVHGPLHESVAAIHSDIGTYYFNNEQYPRALESYELALEIAKEALGEQHEFVIDTHYRIGRVMEAKVVTEEKLEESKQHMLDTLEMREKLDYERHISSNTLGIEEYKNTIPRNLSTDNMDSTLIYHDLAEQARLEGNYEKAQPLYLKSIELRRQKFGPTSPALSPVLLNYAELLRLQGNNEIAKIILQEALTININSYGKTHSNTADIMNSLGLVCRQLRELDYSEEILLQTLKIRRGLFGDIDLSVGATLNNIAELYREKKEYSEAISYHNLSIKAFEGAGGVDHPGTINAKGNLGITLRRYSTVNAELGEELIKDTVEYLTTHNYTESHPWLMKFHQENILTEAQKLSIQGKYDQSLDMYNTIYKKKILPEDSNMSPSKKILPEDSNMSPSKKLLPEDSNMSPYATPSKKLLNTTTAATSTTINNQTSQDFKLIGVGKYTAMIGKIKVYIQQCKFREAEDMLQECAEFPTELLGEDNALVVETQRFQAEICFLKADYDKAIELATYALQSKNDLFGPDSEQLVDVLLLLAECFLAVANYEDAESFLNQTLSLINNAIKRDTQSMGKASLEHQLLYLKTLHSLSKLHYQRGAYTLTISIIKQLNKECKDYFIEDHIILYDIYIIHGKIEEIKGNYIESMVYYNQALDICMKHYNRNHPTTVSILTCIAKISIINCEFTSASKLLHECITILMSYYGNIEPLHPLLSECYLLQASIHIQLHETENAESIIQIQLTHRIQRYGDRHPYVAECLCYLADIYTIQMRLEDANQLYNSALLIRTEIFHDNHIDSIMAKVGTAIVASKQNQYMIAMPIFEECLDNLNNILISVDGRYHTNIAKINIEYGIVAQKVGMINEALILYGKSGADQYSTYQKEQHLRLADCLFHIANISKIQGRYKDAKYQYSICMSIKYRYFGQLHPDILEIIYESADNMKQVGYFNDASVAINALENLTSEKFGKNSRQIAIVYILQANILCDKGLGIKAEVLYKEALNIINEKYGDNNIYILEIKIGLARCLYQQSNLAETERLYKECLILSRQLLGNTNHTTIDIISNLAMTKLNRKPDSVQSSLNIMKEQVQPFYMNNYGSNHPYTIHTNGRIGLLMNSLKKESGRRLILKALKYFDEYKQFQFTHDHPWILELGGFIKRSSQERLSQSIEVQALTSWCMPRFEGDVNYGTIPKHFWVDLTNNAAEAWGQVHYFGVEQEPIADPVQLFQSGREERDGSPGRGSRSSTAIGRPRSSQSRSPTTIPTDRNTTTLENNENKDLASALIAEQKARQDAEDLLENEVVSRRSIEEQLEQEQAARKAMDEKLAAEMEDRKKLEAMFQESMERLRQLDLNHSASALDTTSNTSTTALASAIGEQKDVDTSNTGEISTSATSVIVDTNPTVEVKEGETSATGIGTGIATADAPGVNESEKLTGTDPITTTALNPATNTTDPTEEEEDAVDLTGLGVTGNQKEQEGTDLPVTTTTTATTATITSLTPEEAQANQDAKEAKMTSDLEAAVFLFSRANTLQYEGWYRKAQPLYEECLRIRQLYVSNDSITITSMIAIARNHCNLYEYNIAEDIIISTLKLAEKLYTIESEYFAETLLVKAEILIGKGKFSEAIKILNKATKLITKLLERYPTANKLLGKSVSLQAMVNIRIGKIPESKAMVDRAAAILSKAYGIHHIAVMEANYIKCDILLSTCKYKEVIALIEQVYTMRKRVYGEFHPACADCLVFLGRALVGLGKLTEGQIKYNQAKDIRYEYFNENSIEYSEVLHYEAQLSMILCEYQESLRKNIEVLSIRSVYLSDTHPLMSDTYHSLGVIYTLLGQYVEAGKYLALAMNIRNELIVTPPGMHPLVTQTNCAQAELLRLQGDYDNARILIEQCLEEYKLLYGKENANYLYAQQCFGVLLRDQGDLENADKVNKRTIKYRRQVLGLDHYDLATSLLYQIDVLIELGQIKEAKVMLTEARSILNIHYHDCTAHIEVIHAELIPAFIQLHSFEKQRNDGDVPTDEVATTHAGNVEVLPAQAATDAGNVEALPAQAATDTGNVEALSAQAATDAGNVEALPAQAATDAGNVDTTTTTTTVEADNSTTVAGTTRTTTAPILESDGLPLPIRAAESSSIEIIPEDIHPPPTTMIESAKESIPHFPNADYIHTIEILNSCIQQLQSVYQINMRKIRSIYSNKTSKSSKLNILHPNSLDSPRQHSSSSSSSSVQHPYVLYLQGCVGNIMLLEYLAKQRFSEGLSPEDRERFSNHESYMRLQRREVQTKSPGLLELETAVSALCHYTTSSATTTTTTTTTSTESTSPNTTTYHFNEEHVYIQKLKACINNVVFVLDDMAVAANTFIEANILHQKGKYVEAEEKYNNVFITQMSVLGSEQACNSLVIAETLYCIANNLCYLGEMEFSQFLYNQSIVIYRKQQGSDSEGVLKSYTGLSNILSWQGLYEDSYSMRSHILSKYLGKYTEEKQHSIEISSLKIGISYDLYKLGKYTQALKLGKETLHSLTHLSQPCSYEYIVHVRLLLAYIYLTQGEFHRSKEHIDYIENLVEGQTLIGGAEHDPAIHNNNHNTSTAAPTPPTTTPLPAKEDMLLSICALLECKAEYLLIHSKYFEAQKTINRAFKMKIKALGRTNRIAEGNRNADRKMAFFDSLDTLLSEFKVKTHSNSDDEDEEQGGVGLGSGTGGARKRVINLNRGNKQEEADQQLDLEMQSAFESILESMSTTSAAPSNTTSSGNNNTADVPTSVRFHNPNNRSATTAPVYQLRGVPVQAHPLLADMLYLKGRIAMALAHYTEAKELYDGALNMLNILFSKPSLKKLSISHELANLTLSRGNYEEARVLHTSILQQRLQLCDENHPDKTDSLLMIAILHTILCKYDDSTQMLTETLTIRKKIYGDIHWKVAEVYIECALVLHAKGFHTDSDALYEKAMIIVKRGFGDTHYLLTSIYLGQGNNARSCGLYEQAKAIIDQAIAMRGLLVGENHIDFAKCLYDQALVMRCLGKKLEVKRLLDTAIVIQREGLGKYHPSTAITLLSMGINFMDLALYTTSTHVLNRAIQLIKKSYGSEHIYIACGLTAMAENSRCRGFYEEAHNTHEKALYLRRKLFGEYHSSIAESMYYLGELALILAKYDDAMKYLDDALALVRMSFGQTHPMIATITHSIAKILLAQGKIYDAKSIHERAYSMRRNCLTGDHPDIGESQYNNALVYFNLGKYDQAGALFERCLVSIRDAYGGRHPFVATILYYMGIIMNYIGKYKQAESLLLESLQIRLYVYKEVNENHFEIAETYYGIAQNLHFKGKYEYIDEKDTGSNEIHKVLKSLPQLIQGKSNSSNNDGDDNGLQAPYDVSVSPVQEGYDVAEAILDGNRPNTIPNSSSSTSGNAGTNTSSSNQEKDAHTRDTSIRAVHSAPAPTDSKFNPLEDDMTAPTVMISAIEHIHAIDPTIPTTNTTTNKGDSLVVDDYSIPEQVIDHRSMTDNPRIYQALPMYKRVLTHLTEVFPESHPIILTIQYSIAETTRLMGKYDLALENHQDILEVRRKVLGDNHPDTILSMLAIGESLQGLGRIYPETASGSVDAKQMRVAKQAISLGVSLLDHLGSVVAPVETDGTLYPPPSSASGKKLLDDSISSPRRPNTTTIGTGKKPTEENWDFISKPDITKKKKEVIKLPKGYMGYQFPSLKQIVRTEANTTTRPKKVRTADAKWLYDTSIHILKRLYGDIEHPLLSCLYYAKAELLRLRGDSTQALQLYEQALIMRRKLFRGTHPYIADCIQSIAEIFRSENKFKQALPMYDKALEIRMDVYECIHPSIAEIKNNMALLYFTQGNITESFVLFKEALLLCEQILGRTHPFTANIIINLANLLQNTEHHLPALRLYQYSYSIKEIIYDTEHIEIAILLNNIGLVYKSLKQYKEAEENYMKALTIQKRLYGSVHKDIATTLNNLASLYVSQNKRHEAKEYYKDSISMRTSIYGIEHPTVAATLNNYAGLLFSMGEYEQAKDYFENALNIRKKVYGEHHYAVAETLNNIALLLYTQGQLKESILLYEKTLEIKLLCYGKLNPSVATSYYNIATIYHKNGFFDKAIVNYKHAYDIRYSVLGEVHDDTLLVEEAIKTIEKEKMKYIALYNAKMKESRNINSNMNMQEKSINNQNSITNNTTTTNSSSR